MAKHVIVTGADIVGVSTAIWLRRFGQDVTIVDRDGPGLGTSFGVRRQIIRDIRGVFRLEALAHP